jgi:PAS domain S-box-containing protein
MSRFAPFRIPEVFKDNRSPLKRYGVALVVVAVAVALRELLNPVMGNQSVAFFMVAILLAAWFGGVGPVLLSLVLLHIVHAYWFENPPGLWQPNLQSIVTTIGWYGVGITAGVLSQLRRSALDRARNQQLEAISQREQLRITLSCMADGVIVTDVSGQVTLMNPTAEFLTGWRLEDSQGKQLAEIFVIRREDSSDRAEFPFERVLTGGRIVKDTMPLVLASRQGRTIPVAYNAAAVQAVDGQISGVVIVFRDESERRRAELALQNADRRKDEFLATLAHELRNPLAPICMGLEFLKMSGDDPGSAANVRTIMERQAQHMVRLIDDLLDVSRITRGKLELRRSQIELAGIVQDAVAATRHMFDEAGHQFFVRLPDAPVRLYADGSRLTQVLTNLLNNAAKFTPREGRIELAARNAGGEVILELADSGIGIPADKLDRVFEMFTQIHEPSDFAQAGLGIGLTLVKRLVEMHGGHIDVQSRGRNQGTTFVVRLPTLSEPTAVLGGSTLDPMAAEPVTIKRRVLVVDDNADALESLSFLVARMGGEVRQAHDGLEALEVGRAFGPDIVLMDLGMPNLNGFDAARRMRQEPWGRELVLVATTGWGQDEDRRRSTEAGFDRHLVKPVAIAALREVLEAPPRASKPRTVAVPTASPIA